MGRKPRIHYPGAVYHAFSRGVGGKNIYVDDIDRESFLSRLDRVASATGSTVLAYCLMRNHFHLAIKVDEVPLGSVLQRILTPHAITFNRRHDQEGHLFQARFESRPCLTDAYLTGLIRYIHNNPVRAGLVSHPSEWEWSSYRKYAETNRDGLVENTADLPNFDPWPKETNERPTLIRQLPKVQQDLSYFAALVSNRTGIGIEDLRSGSRVRITVAAKRQFVQDAVAGGHRLNAIAKWLGLTSSALTRYV